MNTGIVATWTWSLGGKTLESEETVAPPHQTVLRFQPLATNSSGLYSLNVTLRSLDNSDYIAENSGSTVYSLTLCYVSDCMQTYTCIHPNDLATPTSDSTTNPSTYCICHITAALC